MSFIIVPLSRYLSWAEHRRKVQAAKRLARITGKTVVLTKMAEEAEPTPHNGRYWE